MNVLPVVQRELLVAARSQAIRWQRFAAVGLGVVAFLSVWFSSSSRTQVFGGVLFVALTAILWIIAWLSGPFFTTDTLTREKREGTLGLLLLTELRGYDIILGKATAAALHQVMLLVGALPVLILPVAMGGVTGGEAFRVMAAVVACQIYSLTLGLFFSAICSTLFQALRWTLGILITTSVLPVLLERLAPFTRIVPPNIHGFGPLSLLLRSFENTNTGVGLQWHQSLWLLGLTSAALILVAGIRLRRSIADGTGPPPHQTTPLTGGRHIADRELLERQPYEWIKGLSRQERRPLGGIAWFLIGAAAVMSLLSAIGMLSNNPLAGWVYLVGTALLYVATQTVVLGLLAAGVRHLGEDLRSGALELLLVTPMSGGQLVRGAHAALLREFRTLKLGLYFVYFLWWIPLAIVSRGFLSEEALWGFRLAQLTLPILFCVLLHWKFSWCSTIALRAGVREAEPMKALRKSIWRGLLPGWCVAAFSVLFITMLSGAHLVANLFCLVPFLLLANYLTRAAAHRADIDLTHGLRDIAAGLHFDTDQRELAEDFRRSAMTWEDRWFTAR